MFCASSCLVSIAGYVAIGYVLTRLAGLVTQLTRASKDLSKYGDYSVVTGPTSGIGKAIAFELAKKGQNLILVARNATKLQNLVKEIQGKHSKCKIVQLTMDLSKLSEDNEKLYKSTIDKYNVGILVNNAGLAYPYTQYLDEVSVERLKDMVEVNSKAPMLLSRLTIDRMLGKPSPQHKGCIVNISSAGSIVPHELHCVYSASKAFLNKFTLDLASEYEGKGIACQVQLPYFVVSPMSKIRRASLTTPTAEAYAKCSVAQIGYSGLLSPYPAHAVIFFVLEFVPAFVLKLVIGKMHHTIRKKGHKKFGFKKE